MKTLLWLDDSRDPFTSDWLIFSPIKRPFQTIWVQNYEDFCDWLRTNGIPDAVCFDHDLGTETTGYDAAKFLCAQCELLNVAVPLYSMQSANTVGRDNIRSYIENFKRFSDIVY